MTPSSEAQGASYVEWGAVIAGSILACAISLVLLQFGGLLGLSIAETTRYEGENRVWRVIIVGVWLLWVQLMASMSGGYLAGRMRAPMENAASHENEIRDGAHGLLVWATSTLVAFAAAAVTAFFAAMAPVDAPVAAAEAQATAAAFTRNAGIILGFLTAAAYIVSAVAAWWMATVGGDHRDRSPDVSRYITFRIRSRA